MEGCRHHYIRRKQPLDQQTYETLEFNTILENLAQCAISQEVKDKIYALKPYTTIDQVKLHQKDTSEALRLLDSLGTPPLSQMSSITEILHTMEIQGLLMPEQLDELRQFIVACHRMKKYLQRGDYTNTHLASYGYAFHDLSDLEDEIYRCIRHKNVDDHSTPELANIRKKIVKLQDRVKEKLNTLLRSKKQYFSESFISLRHGRHTLPVNKAYKSQVKGTVIDKSSSGNTFFIEPSSVGTLQDQISLLEIDEDQEVRRILYTLTALVEDHLPQLKVNIDAMETMDFIFAKGKLSMNMKATEPAITEKRQIIIEQGRHPLLETESVVPLDFFMGDDLLPKLNFRNVVITGPNTGGKTVSIKTVGLLNLMAQCGLHVPAREATFCIQKQILCDIGDHQSISQNLSTFSSHITRITGILEQVDEHSLILLDELGSGTDPSEGMALATVILEELAEKKALVLATTHYPQVKDFAIARDDFMNARMAFDRENLKPLYRLELGKVGDSCALYIASRLGLPEKLIHKANHIICHDHQVSIPTETLEHKDTASLADIISHQERIQRESEQIEEQTPTRHVFEIGDSVKVQPHGKIGIIYELEDDKGNVGVQVQNEKMKVNHKRLKLHVSASQLYPPDYDFSIIFDSADTRKARKKMSKRHCPDLEIIDE